MDCNWGYIHLSCMGAEGDIHLGFIKVGASIWIGMHCPTQDATQMDAPPVNRQTRVKTLPCPILRMQAVNILNKSGNLAVRKSGNHD